ncbi:DUF5753 domain-containing protein, partial [Streptomyces sp. NPDC002276]
VLEPAYLTYAAVEADASEIYSVETSLVPGLLQTPEYTEALFDLQAPDAAREMIAAQLDVRRERKNLLAGENPLQLWVIIAESALRHQVGGTDVMSGQLKSLIADSRERNIELQILPSEDPMNVCLYGPFNIMSFPTSTETDVVYTESPTSSLYYEDVTDVETYTTLFRRLNVAAANVSKSRVLIQNALHEMEQGR